MTESRILSAAAALVLSCAAFAQTGGFTPLGGFGAGCTFSVETAVSGSVRADNGWTVSHGAMPVLAANPSTGIDQIEAELPEGTVEIYSLDGRRVASDIESLDPGIYIISQNGRARKFLKPTR